MIEAPLLRAFLMLRSDDGTWTVTVCRDLGSIVRTWEAGKDLDKSMAVLHVGFDRPPSRVFDRVSFDRAGRVFLTAAAKHALPSSFISSNAPIAMVEGIEVFIGLQGWGYSLEDPTTPKEQPELVCATAPTPQEPSGWLISFLKENPAATGALSEHAIDDDASYFEKEIELARGIRTELGLFRTNFLVGINCDDPCELARAVPPWFADRQLATIALPVRVDNVFRTSDIKTVRDLAKWDVNALLSRKNYGRKSLSDTLLALTAALNEGPPRTATPDDPNEPTTLLAEVRRSLLSFSGREHDILVRRLGFEAAPETLEELAVKYRISRERVRQIAKKAIRKWTATSNWDDILEQKITKMLSETSFPLLVDGVEAIDPWFDGVSSHRKFFMNLVDAVCHERISFVCIDGFFYFSLIDQDTWDSAVSEAADLLSSGSGQEWSEEYARSLVRNVLPDESRKFGPLLWKKSARLCHFSTGPDGSRILASYGPGAEQVVEAILAESDTPLHYSEISKRAKLRTGKSRDTRTVHNAATNVGFLFARGTYGLSKHVPLSDEQMLRIREESEDIVSSGVPGRQWHTSEILSALLRRLDGRIEQIDNYLLDIVLAKSNVLKSLKRMIWAEVGDDTGKQPRIDIHQAIVAIIKEAGRPLSADDIKERLTAVRGVSDFFQIHAVDPLIRLQNDLWDIKDRDVTLTDEQRGHIKSEDRD